LPVVAKSARQPRPYGRRRPHRRGGNRGSEGPWRRIWRMDWRAPFAAAVEAIASASGRVVVTGMGKSGHVARKIAATLASTGAPAFFLHPGEASHGDLGMIASGDIAWPLVVGETPELRDVIQYCKRFGVTLLAVTSEPSSALCPGRRHRPCAPPGARGLPQYPRADHIDHDAAGPSVMPWPWPFWRPRASRPPISAISIQAAGSPPSWSTVGDPDGAGETTSRRILDSATLSRPSSRWTGKRYGAAAVRRSRRGARRGLHRRRPAPGASPPPTSTAAVADHMNRAPVFVAPQLLAIEALR